MRTWEPRGHHPIDIGDVIHDQYRILQLLGGGTFSMVWLAENLQAKATRQPRLVSVKICTADEGEFNPDAAPELLAKLRHETVLLHHIQSLKDKPPSRWRCPSFHPEGGRYIVEMYDEFVVKGPNGAHQCIVLEFCGPSLSHVCQALEDGLPPAVSRKLALQLAQAVAFLQGCNIVHGDLHSGNILIYSTRFRTWGPREAGEHFGKPLHRRPGSNIPGPPHGPKQAVAEISQGLWVDILNLDDLEGDFSDIELRLADFGQSYISEPPPLPRYLGIPPSLAAPEVLVRNCLVRASVFPINALSAKNQAKETPSERLPSPPPPDQIRNPSKNPFLKATGLSASSPFLKVTPRSDLWSLGATLYEVFEYRGPLFATMSWPRETPEEVLYELGRTFGFDSFLKVCELPTWPKTAQDPLIIDVDRVCRRSVVGEEPDGLRHTIQKLLKVIPEERCEAIEVVKLLQEIWPHLKPPSKPTILAGLLILDSLKWLPRWLRSAWESAIRGVVAKRVCASMSSVFGICTRRTSCPDVDRIRVPSDTQTDPHDGSDDSTIEGSEQKKGADVVLGEVAGRLKMD